MAAAHQIKPRVEHCACGEKATMVFQTPGTSRRPYRKATKVHLVYRCMDHAGTMMPPVPKVEEEAGEETLVEEVTA